MCRQNTQQQPHNMPLGEQPTGYAFCLELKATTSHILDLDGLHIDLRELANIQPTTFSFQYYFP